MDGVLVLDKPQGLTSHDVVAVVRRALHERRIGHTGTLDPLATGVLPMACGRATRLVRFLSAAEKDYEATLLFGVTTDSYDITGLETSRVDRVPRREAVVEALESLRGEYAQMPPPFSAKKVNGQRAYALARRAEPVDLKPVTVRVPALELIEFDRGRCVIRLTCSAGFYVRAFAHALGASVGTGACLEALRRTRSGDFGLDAAVSVDELLASAGPPVEALIPLADLLPRFPTMTVTDEGRARIAHGRPVGVNELQQALPADVTWVRLLDQGGALLAMGTPGVVPGTLHPEVVLI